MPLKAVAAHFGLNKVLLDDGSTIPILEYYDRDGEEWDGEDFNDVVAFIAGNDEAGYYTCPIAAFRSPTKH